MSKLTGDFTWVGCQENFVDKPNILQLNHIVVGQYGGNSTAGQYKNEDGCLVWLGENEEWEFSIILDAHYTAESAEIVLEQFIKKKSEVVQLFSLSTN